MRSATPCLPPRSSAGRGPAGSQRALHPFEEICYFLSGGMLGTLDGDEVDVATGDMIWTGVDATHGFIKRRDEPATWLEAQSPGPPDSGAFFIPEDWRALPR